MYIKCFYTLSIIIKSLIQKIDRKTKTESREPLDMKM